MKTLVALMFALACNSPEQAQQSADHGQANADYAQQKANLALTTAKSDSRNRVGVLLVDLDKKMADLRADNLTAKPDAKQKNEAQILAIQSSKATLTADLLLIDGATAATWDTLQKQVDMDSNSSKNALKL